MLSMGEVKGPLGVIHNAPASFPIGKRWACVRTYPHEEGKAEEAIRALGFTVFAPKFRKWIRHARRKKEVERYLFPCYLFVFIDPNMDSWGLIRAPDRYGLGVDGVHSIITNCGVPVFLPRLEADRMLQEFGREDAGMDIFSLTGLKEGEDVEVTEGPFMGHCGRLEGLSDRHRVQVLLSFLGSQRIFDFSLSQLKPA